MGRWGPLLRTRPPKRKFNQNQQRQRLNQTHKSFILGKVFWYIMTQSSLRRNLTSFHRHLKLLLQLIPILIPILILMASSLLPGSWVKVGVIIAAVFILSTIWLLQLNTSVRSVAIAITINIAFAIANIVSMSIAISCIAIATGQVWGGEVEG